MSDVAEATRNEDQRSDSRLHMKPSRMAFALLVGLLLVAVGYFVGVSSPWTAHRPHVVSGTAWRQPANIPVAFFDSGNGDAVEFRLDDVVWKSGDETGDDSLPPCLRDQNERAAVEAGLIELTRPYGNGSYFRVVSVTCLSR